MSLSEIFSRRVVVGAIGAGAVTGTRPDIQTLDNFIGGRWVKARATEFFDVHNPAVGEVIGRTPLSTIADVDAAVDAAAKAFPAWRDTTSSSALAIRLSIRSSAFTTRPS